MTETNKATFGGGCFWCVEAAFKELQGVTSAVSGYSGGDVEDPSYRLVCSGTTDHAEVVQVTYEPDTITYDELLKVFFTIHDPTQRNRQGPDIGPQYRSIIFYHNDDQKSTAQAMIDALEASGAYDDPIVTELEELETFYTAESYHQDYYENNPEEAYCQRMIPPQT
ncbi:MAG: peptide-methionine (S)-S-oxide reductase MsrA [bacterium]